MANVEPGSKVSALVSLQNILVRAAAAAPRDFFPLVMRLSKLPASDPHQVKPLRRAIGCCSTGEASDSLVIRPHKP